MDTTAVLKKFNEYSKGTLMETLDIEYIALGKKA